MGVSVVFDYIEVVDHECKVGSLFKSHIIGEDMLWYFAVIVSLREIDQLFVLLCLEYDGISFSAYFFDFF